MIPWITVGIIVTLGAVCWSIDTVRTIMRGSG